MKRKSIGIAAGLLLSLSSFNGTVSAAANPYADVPHSDWAYTTVEQLIQQGLVSGCSDDDFKSQKRMTRHDLAVYIAQAMSQRSNASTEARLSINRLEKEYAHELHVIGVEDDAIPAETPAPQAKTPIEQKLNNFNIFGWGRIRYDGFNPHGRTMAHNNKPKYSSDSHVNVDLIYNYKLNDQWNFQGETQAGRSMSNNGNSWFTGMEKMFLEGHVNGTNIRMGRYDMASPMAFVYDEKVNGVSVQFGKTLQTKLDFGKVVASDENGIKDKTTDGSLYGNDSDYTFSSPNLYSIRFDTPLSKATSISAGYYHISGGQIWQLQDRKRQANFYSVAVNSKLNNKWKMDAVIGRSTATALPDRYLNIKTTDRTCYMVKFSYGHSDFANPGSWSAFLIYRHSPQLASFSNTDDWIRNIEGIRIGGDYMFTKNMGINTYYTWGRDVDTHVRDDSFRFQLNWAY